MSDHQNISPNIDIMCLFKKLWLLLGILIIVYLNVWICVYYCWLIWTCYALSWHQQRVTHFRLQMWKFGRVNNLSFRVVSLCYVYRCLSFCPFFFRPLCCLFFWPIVLSVLLRYTDSGYTFGIVKLFLPCVGVVVSLISTYGVDVSLLDRCFRAFELKKTRFGSSLPPVVCRRANISLCGIWLFAHSPVLSCLRVLSSVLSVTISA
jgi:hypothetical protein